jgi:hypothetical protein
MSHRPLINSAKPAMKLCNCERSGSCTSCPGPSNARSAWLTRSRGPNHGRVPRVRKTGSQAVCARSVPPRPGVAPINATGRLPKTRGMSAGGRVSQSIAFLKTPGIELLYSGVTRSRPSRDAIFQIPHDIRDSALSLYVPVVQRDAADRRDLHASAIRSGLFRGAQERRVV